MILADAVGPMLLSVEVSTRDSVPVLLTGLVAKGCEDGLPDRSSVVWKDPVVSAGGAAVTLCTADVVKEDRDSCATLVAKVCVVGCDAGTAGEAEFGAAGVLLAAAFVRGEAD